MRLWLGLILVFGVLGSSTRHWSWRAGLAGWLATIEELLEMVGDGFFLLGLLTAYRALAA
ncbi:MAG: hypothetical protein QOJ29_2878 [Thermoleophilaceae bacterium]|jgi:hypothetical protein|nr:hypothetical protein [Thermoleophilaceae bacterium]